MSGKRSGVGGRFKATPPDDNPKVAAIVGEKDEEEMESENNIVVSESETSDRVLRKVVVTDTAAKTDGVNDRNPTTSTTTTTSTSGPKTRATRLRDDAAIVAAAAVVTTKRNRKQPRDLDLKNSSDEENDVTNIDETPPADDDDDKDSETDDADETCFKIDKVYTVSDEQNDLEMTVTTEGESGKQKVGGEDLKDDCNAGKGRGGVGGSGDVTTPTAVVSGVKLVDAAKLKEEKQIKPRIQATATLAKLPAGLGGGVGSVRMLGAGVRGTNMPFIVSMGAGNPGIPLLPAGLPPGRYVILPGSSTTTSKTATVTTMAASGLTTRLATTATGHTTVVTAQKAISAASTTPRTATPTPTPTPSPQQVAVATAVAAGGGRLYTRERGRRKSYTTGEKLAMIEAVEGGQRKSVVADRFGVAPSTLACILAQRHKIRSEKDNLARRRVRHNRYQELREDMVGGGVVSSSAASVSSVSPPHQPFTHFLAPLTSPTPPTFLDTQPEEIIAVPDLVDRVPGTSSSKDHDHDPDHDQDPQVIMDQDSHHMDPDDGKGTKSFHPPQTHHTDVGDDPLADHQRQSPSPTHSNTGNIAGLVGPYLLKKETHCTTVLDQLMRDDTFTDVTLTAQGQSLRAHRIVLCLASSYFRQVLSRDMGVQSVIVLRDIKFAELRNIIHFIYTGEATVDASELESFMRTAELLEISSLCEGQKCITGRSHSSSSSNNTTTNTNNHSSSFSVGDFERLVGTKRPRKDTSPTSARTKTRRHSGDGGSSRCSSTEPPPTPTTTNNSLTLVKEEPDCDITQTFTPIITSVASCSSKIVASDAEFLESDNGTTTEGGGGEQTSEATGSSERSRRDSTGSVGGFAAIAGVQQKMVCEEEGDDDPGEVFSPASHPTSPAPVPSPSPSQAGPPHTTHTPDLTPADTTAVPGRCPYCPHISHKFEGLTMMSHLLVSHPCKPAFPCATCWRVFVKRVAFKAHQQICQQQQLGS